MVVPDSDFPLSANVFASNKDMGQSSKSTHYKFTRDFQLPSKLQVSSTQRSDGVMTDARELQCDERKNRQQIKMGRIHFKDVTKYAKSPQNHRCCKRIKTNQSNEEMYKGVSKKANPMNSSPSFTLPDAPSLADFDDDEKYQVLGPNHLGRFRGTHISREEEINDTERTSFRASRRDMARNDEKMNEYGSTTLKECQESRSSVRGQKNLLFANQENSIISGRISENEDLELQDFESPFASHALSLRIEDDETYSLVSTNSDIFCAGRDVFSFRNNNVQVKKRDDFFNQINLIAQEFLDLDGSSQMSSCYSSRAEYTEESTVQRSMYASTQTFNCDEDVKNRETLPSCPLEVIMKKSAEQIQEEAAMKDQRRLNVGKINSDTYKEGKRNVENTDNKKNPILRNHQNENSAQKLSSKIDFRRLDSFLVRNLDTKAHSCENGVSAREIKSAFNRSSGQQYQFEKSNLLKSRPPTASERSRYYIVEGSKISDVQKEHQGELNHIPVAYGSSYNISSRAVCYKGKQILDGCELGNNDHHELFDERTEKAYWSRNPRQAGSLEQSRYQTDSLKTLLNSVNTSGSNEEKNDNLILDKDHVVRLLIREGKLPGQGIKTKPSDSEPKALRKNTAELLRNLSILRARRATSKHRMKTNSLNHSTSSPGHGLVPRKFHVSQNKNSCDENQTFSNHRLPTFPSSRSEKFRECRLNTEVSNFSDGLARQHEAAKRVRQQAHELKGRKSNMSETLTPSTSLQKKNKQVHRFGISTSKNNLNESKAPPPPPETITSRLEGLHRQSFFAQKGTPLKNGMQIVKASKSDIDMQEWEKIKLMKLPLVLNLSNAEYSEGKNEYQDTYENDDYYTSESDDTMSDETLDSTSDSQRLRHIASMLAELRLRRLNNL
jgi:hypothetical protein